MDLPRNKEAEKQVLTNMLFSSDIMIETFSRLNADDFFEPENKIIFETMNELKQKANVEPYALIDALSINGNLEKVGGASYILELADAYCDVANANYFINSVEEKSILRKLISYSANVVNKWPTDSADDITNYINKINKDISDIAGKKRVEDFVTMENAVNKYKERVNDLKTNKNEITGLLSGYTTFDNIMLGFNPGGLYILAARPAVGKTALALNFLVNTAKRTTKPCVFFSLEMGVEQILNRILSCVSTVPSRKVQTATFSKDEEVDLNKAMKDITAKNNIYIDETPAIKVINIRSKLTKLKSVKGDIGLVVVDYIGLITPDIKSKGDSTRALELGQISAGLKAIAREFNCPVLVLSQLSRGVEQRTDKTPMLSDLRESGSIEQDADVVMFIHRPDYGKQDNNENNTDPEAASDSPVSLIIAKNRNGNLATIDFMFQKNISRFIEMDKNR